MPASPCLICPVVDAPRQRLRCTPTSPCLQRLSAQCRARSIRACRSGARLPIRTMPAEPRVAFQSMPADARHDLQSEPVPAGQPWPFDARLAMPALGRQPGP